MIQITPMRPNPTNQNRFDGALAQKQEVDEGSVNQGAENQDHPEADVPHLVPKNEHASPASQNASQQGQPVQRDLRHAPALAPGLKLVEAVQDERRYASGYEPDQVGIPGSTGQEKDEQDSSYEQGDDTEDTLCPSHLLLL